MALLQTHNYAFNHTAKGGYSFAQLFTALGLEVPLWTGFTGGWRRRLSTVACPRSVPLTVFVSSTAGCMNNDCSRYSLPSVTDNNNATYLATTATSAAVEVVLGFGSWQRDIVQAVLVAAPGTGQAAWLQNVSIILQSGIGGDVASCGAGVSAAAPLDRIVLHCQRITGPVDRVAVRRPASAVFVPLAFAGLVLYADDCPGVMSGQLAAAATSVTWLPTASKFSNGYQAGVASSFGLVYAADNTCGLRSATSELGPSGASGPTLTVKLAQTFSGVLVVTSQHKTLQQNHDVWVSRTTAYTQGLRCSVGPAAAAGATRVVYCPAMRGVAYLTIVRAPQTVTGAAYLDFCEITLTGHQVLDTGIPHVPDVAHFDASYGLVKHPSTGKLAAWRDVDSAARPRNILNFTAGCTEWTSAPGSATYGINFNGTCMGRNYNDLPGTWNRNLTGQFTIVWIARFGVDPNNPNALAQYVMSLSRSPASTDTGLFWATNELGITDSTTAGNGGDTYTTIGHMPNGSWTFEAITRHWNGENVVYFHKSETTEGFSVDISNGANAIGPDNLVLGADYATNTKYLTNGQVGVLLIYNRMLVPTQLYDLINYYRPRFGLSGPPDTPRLRGMAAQYGYWGDPPMFQQPGLYFGLHGNTSTTYRMSADLASTFEDCLVSGPVPPTVAGWKWSGGSVGSPTMHDATLMPPLTATGVTTTISSFHLVEEHVNNITRYYPSVLLFTGVTNSKPMIFVQLAAPWPLDRALVLQRSDDGVDVYDVDYVPAAAAYQRTWFVLRGWNTPGRNVTSMTPVSQQPCESAPLSILSYGDSSGCYQANCATWGGTNLTAKLTDNNPSTGVLTASVNSTITMVFTLQTLQPTSVALRVIVTPMAPPSSPTDQTWFQGIQVTLLDSTSAITSVCSSAASIEYMGQDRIMLVCEPAALTVYSVRFQRAPGANGIPITGGIGIAELSIMADTCPEIPTAQIGNTNIPVTWTPDNAVMYPGCGAFTDSDCFMYGPQQAQDSDMSSTVALTSQANETGPYIQFALDSAVSGAFKVSLAISDQYLRPLHLSIWISTDPEFQRSGKKCAYGVSGTGVNAAAVSYSCPTMKKVAYVTVHHELRPYSGSAASLAIAEISFTYRKWLPAAPPPPPPPPAGPCTSVVTLSPSYYSPVGCYAGNCTAWGFANLVDGQLSTTFRTAPVVDSVLSVVFYFMAMTTNIAEVQFNMPLENVEDAQNITIEVVFLDATRTLCASHAGGYRAGEWVTVSCMPRAGMAVGIQITRNNATGSLAFAELKVVRDNCPAIAPTSLSAAGVIMPWNASAAVMYPGIWDNSPGYSATAANDGDYVNTLAHTTSGPQTGPGAYIQVPFRSPGGASPVSGAFRVLLYRRDCCVNQLAHYTIWLSGGAASDFDVTGRKCASAPEPAMPNMYMGIFAVTLNEIIIEGFLTPAAASPPPPPLSPPPFAVVLAPPNAYTPPPPPLVSSCITQVPIASIDGAPFVCYLGNCNTYGLTSAQDGNPLTALRIGGSVGVEPSVDLVLANPTKRITEIKLKAPAYGAEELMAIRVDLVAANGSQVTCATHASAYLPSADIMVACPFTPLSITRVRLRRRMTDAPNYKSGYLLGVAEIAVLADACPAISELRFTDPNYYPVRWSSAGAVLWPGVYQGDPAKWGPQNANDDVTSVYAAPWDYQLAHTDGTGPTSGPGEYLQVPLEAPATGVVRVTLWHRTQSPLHATYLEVWVSSAAAHRSTGRLCAAGVHLAERPTNFTGPFTFNCPPFENAAYVTIQRNNPPVFSSERVVELTEVDLEVMYADASPPTTQQQLVTVPVGYSTSSVFVGPTQSTAAACPSVGVVQAVWLAAGGSGSWISYLGIVLCGDGTSVGPTAKQLAYLSLGPPSGGLNVTCPGGFDAIRGEESAPGQPLMPVTALALRCSSTGSWSSPVGTGDAGVVRNATVSACPSGAVIYGFNMTGNTTALGAIQPLCVIKPGAKDWDPVKRCPQTAGYTLVPGWYPAGPTTLYTITKLPPWVDVDIAATACTADPSCTSIGYSVDSYGNATYYTYNSTDPAEFAAAMGNTLYTGVDGCSGTLAPSTWAGGPSQWYCATGIRTDAPVLSTTSAGPNDCAAYCDNDPNCESWTMDASGTTCTAREYGFGATAWADDSSTGVTCVVADDPWLCPAYGWRLRGALLNSSIHANPETCKASCAFATPDCTHFTYSTSTLLCELYGASLMAGGVGSNGPITANMPDRVCAATPQHPKFGLPAGNSRAAHSSMCWPGVRLVGTGVSPIGSAPAPAPPAVPGPAPAPAPVTTTSAECARRCMADSTCVHWSLRMGGGCDLYDAGAVVAGQAAGGYGPDAGVAQSCLANVQGTFHCAPARQGVRFELDATYNNVTTRTGCAQLCKSSRYCVGFVYYLVPSGASPCHLMARVFAGAADVTSVHQQVPQLHFQACLRTHSMRQVYSNVGDEPQACATAPGYTFYPAPSGVASYSVIAATVLSNTTGWLSECDTNPSCVGVQVAAGVATLMGGSTVFQGLAVQPGLPGVNGSCEGFYARSPRGIKPFMCVPGLYLPAASMTSSSTVASARECEALCRSYTTGGCDVFRYTETGPGSVSCEIMSGLFTSSNLTSYVAGISSTAATTCVPATDPWYCLPYGFGITGEVLAGYPTASGTGEACAYACQTTPTCSAYLHSPDSLTGGSCTLLRSAFNGPNGTAALLADGRARACVKTPQFSHPTGSVPFWSHMCYTGVDLGGTVVSTLSNVDGHTCAKWCAAYGSGCSHWQLSSKGLCEARTGPMWTNASGMVAYGPRDGIAAACLRATGTFMCLRDGASVAHTVLNSSTGVPSNSACANLCLAIAECEVMAYDLNTTCVLGSRAFLGPSGTNGFEWANSTLTTTFCLRTPYLGGWLFGSSLTPSPPPSPVPPSPALPPPEPPSPIGVIVSGGSAGTAGIIVNTILSGVSSPPPPSAAGVLVPDTTAPVISLFGLEEVVVEVYGTYSEGGALAVDDRDGLLTVDIQGTVNTSVLSLGLPTQILYLAADRAGNIGVITRSVYVVDTCATKDEFRCPVTKECSVFKQCLFIPDPQAINKTVAINGQSPSAKPIDTAPPNITFVGAELLELYDVQTAAGNLTVAVEVVFAGNSFIDKGVLAFDYLSVNAAEGMASQVALNLTDRVAATISAPASSAADTDAAGVSTTIFTDIPTGNSTSEGSPYSIQYDVMDDAGNKATALKLLFILCEPPDFVCPDNTTFEGTCSQGGLCQFNTSKITTNDTGLPRSNETAVAIVSGPPDPDNLIDALLVPVFVINGAGSVSIAQYLPYVPCRAGVISKNCDPGAKGSLRSLGDLNHRIFACADKVPKPLPYSVVGLQYCGIDTTTPGTYTVTYHLSWPSVGTLVIKRQLLVVERCVGETLCPDGFCSVELSCARNVSTAISSFIVATGDANGLMPNSTSLSTNNPPALFLKNGDVVNTTVVVPRGTPYMVCAADQVPTPDRPCEPLGTALDVEDGNITAMITLCPPDDCAGTQCRDHRADRKQPSECGIDTVNATVGSSFRMKLVVFDSKGANATAERLVTVVKPCEVLESYCRITRAGMPVYVCSNVTCETLEPLNDEITRSGGGLSAVPPRLFLLPGLLTNNLTLAERDQSLFLTYGTAAPVSLAPCVSFADTGCAAVANDTTDGDLTRDITVTVAARCPSGVTCVACSVAALTTGTCLPGRYLVRYRVKDTDGNSATVQLSVAVEQLTVTLLDFSLYPGGSALASISLTAATNYANTMTSNTAARARVLAPIFTAFGIQSGAIRAIVVEAQPALEARYFENTTQIYYVVRMVLRVTTGSSDFTSATSTLDTSSSSSSDQSAAADNSTSTARRRALPAFASDAARAVLGPLTASGQSAGILLGTAAQSPRRGVKAATSSSPDEQRWQERFSSLHGALDSLDVLLGVEEYAEDRQQVAQEAGRAWADAGLAAVAPERGIRRRYTLAGAGPVATSPSASWRLPAGARLAAAAPRRTHGNGLGAPAAEGGTGSDARGLLASRRRLQVVVNGGCGGPALAAPPNSSFSSLGLADVRAINSSCATPQSGDMDVALTVLAGAMADLERLSAGMLEDEASMDTTLMALDPKFTDVDAAYQTTYTDFTVAAGAAYGSMLGRAQALLVALDRSAATQSATTSAVTTLLSLMQALLNEMQQITARAELTTKVVLDGLAEDGTLTDEELANYTSCLFLRGKEASFSFRTAGGGRGGTAAAATNASTGGTAGGGARRRNLLGPELLYSPEGAPAGAAASPAAMRADGTAGKRRASAGAAAAAAKPDNSWVPGWVQAMLRSPAAWFSRAGSSADADSAWDAQQAQQRRSLLALANGGDGMDSFFGYDLPDGSAYDYSLWDVRNADRARWIGHNNRVLVGLLMHQVRRSSAELERAKGSDGYICRDSSFSNLIVGCNNTTANSSTSAASSNSTSASARVKDLGGIGNDPVFSRHSALYQASLDPADYYNTSQGSPELNPGGLPYGFFHQPAGRLAPGYPLVLDTHLSAKRAEQAITYIRDGGYLAETLTKTLRVQLVSYNADAQVFGYLRLDLSWLDSGLIGGATRLLALPAVSYGAAVQSAQVQKFLPDFFLILLCCGYLLVTAYDVFVQLHRQAQMRKLRALLRKGKNKGGLEAIHEADDDNDDDDHMLGIGDNQRKVLHKQDGTKVVVKLYKPRMSVGWVVFEAAVCVLMFTSLGFLFAYTAKLADKNAFPSRFELYDADGYAPARYFLPLRRENVTVTQSANTTTGANFTTTPTPGSANRWQLPEDKQMAFASDFYDRVDDMYDLLLIYTFLQGFVLAMIVIRWLHYLSFQPRLSAISGTLALAASDIIHFFIVIVICAVMFGAAGCIVFGPDEDRLSDYGDALHLILSYVLLREDGGVFKALLDKVKQRDEGTIPTEVVAGLLYALGPLFFVFIMSNFIMAFLAWPYGLLRVAVRDAPGVPQDVRSMLGMLWQCVRYRAPSNRHMEKWFKRQVVPEVRDRGLMYRLRETMANAYQSIAAGGKAAAVAAVMPMDSAAVQPAAGPPLPRPPVATAATRRKSLVKMAPGAPVLNADALAAALLSVSRTNFEVEHSPHHAATNGHMGTTKLDPLLDSDEEDHSGSTPPSADGAAAATTSTGRLGSAPMLASPRTPGHESVDDGSARPPSQDASGRSTPLPKLSMSGASSRLRGGKSSRVSAPGQATEPSALVHTVMANLLARYGHEKVIAADAPPPAAPRSKDSLGAGGNGGDSTEVSEFGEARRRITVDGSLGSVTDAGRVRGPGAAGGPSEWAQLAPGAMVRRSITGQAEGAGVSGVGSPALAGTDGSAGSQLSVAAPGSRLASPPPAADADDAGGSASASPRVGALAARPPRLQAMGVSSRLGRRTSQSSFKAMAGGEEGGYSASGSAQSPVMTSGSGQAALTSPRGEQSPAAATSAFGAKQGRMSLSGPSPLGAGPTMTGGAVRRSMDLPDAPAASKAREFEAGVSALPKLPPIGAAMFGNLAPMTAAGERGRRRAGDLDSPGSSAPQPGPGTPGGAPYAHLDQLNEHRGEDWTGPAPAPGRDLGQAKAWLTFKHAVKRRDGRPDGDEDAGGGGGGDDEGLGGLAPRVGSVMVEGQVKVLDPAAAAAAEAEERAAAERGVVQGLRAPMRRASAVLLPEPDMQALAPILSVDPASQLPALPSTQVVQAQPDVLLLDHDTQLPAGAAPLAGPAPGGASPTGAAKARRAGLKQAKAWGSVKRSAAREAAQAMSGVLDKVRASGSGQVQQQQQQQQPGAGAPAAAPPEPQEPQPWFSRPAGLNTLAPNAQRRLSVAAGGPEQELLLVDSDGADTDGSGRGGFGARNLRARGAGGAGPVAEAMEARAVPSGADSEQAEDPAALPAPGPPGASRRPQGVKFAVDSLPTSDSEDEAAGPFAARGRSAALVAVATGHGGGRGAKSGGLASMVFSMLEHLEALLAQLRAAIAELKLMSEVLAAMLAHMAGVGPDSAHEAREAAREAARKAARELLLAYKRDALLTAPLPELETKRLPPLPLALPATGPALFGTSKAPLPPLRTNPMFRQRSIRRTGSARRGALPPMPMPGVLYSIQSLARNDGAMLATAQSSGGAALEILQHLEEQLETRLGMPLAQRKSLRRVADEVAAELVRAERAESRAHVLQQVASLRHGSAGHSGYNTSGYGASGYGASGYGGAAALAAAAAAADSAHGAAHNTQQQQQLLHAHQHQHQHRGDGGRSVQAAGSHVSGTHRRGWGARRRAMAAAEEKWLEELPAEEQLAALMGRTGSYAPGKRKSRLLLGGGDSRAASRVMERDFTPAALIGGGREASVGGAGADAMEAGTPLARADLSKAGNGEGQGGLGSLLGSPAAGSPARMRLPPLKTRAGQTQSDLPL
ncbi:hypothetical protein HYH02_002759 [Chlamydomonas schloesseri]|uniref:Apple domain-containing protein n=1 Tax=Chlamydomonas schloesseri TaxID=2026947 RepID=A0A835WTL1_9CHLO|nr:hypothetical protein HYH02_002759 [Chlamydomonas schloesseri]|eukprot:KAG2452521.1 hypothetical protein HYH02_002759 [Chlamydomonas schloesseri]